MALARIITRSHSCSRELALDLIARGYAVEIVSPDSIPDNLADLELRVEEDHGNQLVASVPAHNGDLTASLEFVHHLKAPMADFIRRPPEPHEAVHSPEKPVRFNADQNGEVVELPADAPQLAPETVFPAAEILHDAELVPELNRDDAACPVLPPHQSPSPPVEPPGHVAAVVSTMARPMISKPTIAKSTMAKSTMAKSTMAKSTITPSVREWEWRDRPAGWPSWRTALTVVSAVLLALVLSYGVRRTNKASAQSSGPTEKVSPLTGVSLSSAANPKKGPGKVSALAVSPPAIKSEQNSVQTPKESHVATAEAASARSGAMVSRRHGDDLIAPDTVTYFVQHTFDEPASRAETSQRSAARYPSSRTQSGGGVIAANTVTLNDKPAPKGAKQESDIKHSSDLK
jgi:hypothetical protein